MSKNKEINFVGHPIFKQIIDLLKVVDISSLINLHNSDRYYKAFKTRTHIITMLFGIFSGRLTCENTSESMLELTELLRNTSRSFKKQVGGFLGQLKLNWNRG